jgi:hypothetical protein
MQRVITFLSQLSAALLCFLAVTQPVVAQHQAVTTYASNPVERKANYAQRMDRYTASGLNVYYEQMIAKTDPWVEIGRRFHYLQLDENDLVDVIAYFWMHAHGVSHNLMPAGNSDRNYDFKWSFGTFRAIRNQVRTSFETSPDFAKMTNSSRQRMADVLMFETVIQQQALIMANDRGKDDTALRNGFTVINRQMVPFDFTMAALGTGGFYAPPGTEIAFPFENDKPRATAPLRVNAPLTTPVGLLTVVGVYYESNVRQIIGSEPGQNGAYVDQITTTLFANGTACQNCHDAWAKGSEALAQEKRNEPENFGSWKMGPNGPIVTIGSVTDRLKKADQFHGGTPATRLNATLTTAGGFNSGQTYLGSTELIQFRADGRFSLVSDKAERQSRRNAMGRYTVQGYRIRLDYDDGYSAIHGFAISANDPNFLIVGTDAFYISNQ